MEPFIEVVLELFFGLFKQKPEQMPDIEYKPAFTVEYNSKRMWILMIPGLVLVIGALIMAYIGNGIGFALLLGIPGMILLLVFVYMLSYKCVVDEKRLVLCRIFFLKKVVLWKDILCLRVIEKKDEASVTIALYTYDKKCAIDLESSMENFWEVVRMAEEKMIEIKKEKDLSIKEILHL